MCEHLISIFCEHGAPHIFQTDNGREFTNNMLNTALLTQWKSTRFVHGRPRKSTDQGCIERANQDVEKLLFARLKSLKKPMDRWVSELKYVQYTKNTVKHSALGRSPFEVHFGRSPPDLSVDLMLPQEQADSLHTEDDVEKALQMGGQIIEFSTQTTETQQFLSHYRARLSYPHSLA